mmetsp:Transcript_32726/g.86002  ORF Transcript_32726/g.86002 Transcript_32726/m.86002 type:complete len:220 (+) Transcript_32726:1730-2389(+)
MAAERVTHLRPSEASDDDRTLDTTKNELAQDLDEHRLAAERRERHGALWRVEPPRLRGRGDDYGAGAALDALLGARAPHEGCHIARSGRCLVGPARSFVCPARIGDGLANAQPMQQVRVATLEAAELPGPLPHLDIEHLPRLVDLREASQSVAIGLADAEARVHHSKRLEQLVVQELVERQPREHLEQPSKDISRIRVPPRLTRMKGQGQPSKAVDELC